MAKQTRRRLLAVIGAGAVASGRGWAAVPQAGNSPFPRVLINTVGVRLQKSSAGSTALAVDFAGSLDHDGHLHVVGGQLAFSRWPTEDQLVRAIRKEVIRSAAVAPAVHLRPDDITVAAPRFL